MIAFVRGTVEDIGLDACVVETAGIGYRIHTTPATLATLRTGQRAELASTLIVREDSMTLFGFATGDERDLFEMLQTVNGVGPRLALAMLAVHSPDGLRAAVAAEDVKALTKVPGIGEKGARRIIVDLGDRLGPPTGPVAGTASAAAPVSQAQDDVVAALVGLGWPAKTAQSAVADVFESATDLDSGEALRAALQRLGGTGRG